MGCQTGTGDCAAALLLTAEISEFHDERLADATAKIRAILEALPQENSQGWTLSFLQTNMGTLLAYVDHNATFPANEPLITAESDDKEVIAALGLKTYAASRASSR